MVAKLAVVAIPRQSAASGFELPGIAPTLGFLERHPVLDQAVSDGSAARPEDALGIGASGHGDIVRCDVTAMTAR